MIFEYHIDFFILLFRIPKLHLFTYFKTEETVLPLNLNTEKRTTTNTFSQLFK